MIRRRIIRRQKVEEIEPRGFDDFELRLGDTMRGERATLGKSLLDVERELRIRASYISAIENADPDSFDTPGFIPGYVRSYARYLNMDPDKAFNAFCVESGFTTAHGMSDKASSIRKSHVGVAVRHNRTLDPVMGNGTPFLPETGGLFARIEAGAIGSALILVMLIGAIGYGGWGVLNQIQQVQLIPVENTPDVLSDLDPLAGVGLGASLHDDAVVTVQNSGFRAPDEDRLDRLYRPEALDVPVLVARDAPISTLDPSQVGTLRPVILEADRSSIETAILQAQESPSPQVVEITQEGVQIVAVRPAWVRVRAANGTVIYEGIMNAGATYDVPATQDSSSLRAGESGAIYLSVNGQLYGPVGDRGAVTPSLELNPDELVNSFAVADLEQDQDLQEYVAALQSGTITQE